MNNLHFFPVFAFILFAFPHNGKGKSDSGKISVDIYKEKYFEGNKTILMFSKCLANLTFKLKDPIKSINSRGNCVNLYEDSTCSGDYSVVAPGTPIHYDLAYWMGNKSIQSIGRCYERCHSKSMDAVKNGTDYLVTLYDEAKYQGPHLTLNLSSGCVPLPLNLKGRISSVKVHGNFCVEIHHNWNCLVSSQADYAQLRHGSASHEDLIHWVGHNDMAKALSLCGFGCDKKIAPKTNESIATTQHKLTSKFIVFDEPHFQGNFRKSYVLQENKCVNVDYVWDGQIQSCLNTNENCVIVYDEFNCTSSTYGRNLTIPGNSSMVGADLRSSSLNKVIQSMKLCSKEEKAKAESVKGASGTSGRGVGFSILLIFIGMMLSTLLIFGLAYANYRFRICPTIGQRFRSGDGHSLIL